MESFMNPVTNTVDTEDDLIKDFVSFDDVQNQKERGFLQNQVRRAERYLQRGSETIFGLPGDVVQLLRSGAQKLPGGITAEEDLNFIERGGRKLLEALPGSAELRARSAEYLPDLEPESESEEIEDELVSDFAALALPVKGKIPFARALGVSVAGNAGKQAMKQMGFDENAQDLTKMGMMLFSGMFGRGRGINKYISNLYKEAESFVPEGAKMAYPTKKINSVENILKKGTLNDAKQGALSIVEDIKAKSPQGMMAVDEAVQFDKDINRAIAKAQRAGDKSKAGYLKQVKGAHASSMDEYAKQNPSWGDNWNKAKQAYAGIAQSENIKEYIKSNANLKNASHAAILLGIGETAIPGMYLEKAGVAGGAAATRYAAEVAKRLAKNPALRQYYQNVMTASLGENKAMLARNLAGLERTAKKEFENNPFPIFEFDEEEEISN